MRQIFQAIAVTLLLAVLAPVSVQAEDVRHKPFVHAYNSAEPLEAVAAEVRAKLTDGGFTIAGEYSPYEGTRVFAVTSDALQAAASATEFGAYAAAQRVSLTAIASDAEEGDSAHIQVAYTNPVYMALAYRLDADLVDVRAALEGALGAEADYGSKKGLKVKKLKKYRYMGLPMFTERFDEHYELISYGSYEEALAKVEEGLAAGTAGTSKVYRIDMPGKDQTLFGVALSRKCSGDQHIMEIIDFKDMRQTAHLPYELLVTGGDVTALAGRFRIAIDFPDLGMVGSHGFTSIMCAPPGIRKALGEAAGVAPK